MRTPTPRNKKKSCFQSSWFLDWLPIDGGWQVAEGGWRLAQWCRGAGGGVLLD